MSMVHHTTGRLLTHLGAVKYIHGAFGISGGMLACLGCCYYDPGGCTYQKCLQSLIQQFYAYGLCKCLDGACGALPPSPRVKKPSLYDIVQPLVTAV